MRRNGLSREEIMLKTRRLHLIHMYALGMQGNRASRVVRLLESRMQVTTEVLEALLLHDMSLLTATSNARNAIPISAAT